MKLWTILSLLATVLLPIMPASAGALSCGMTSSSPNEGSSLTSTSEGGNAIACVG